ncbi:MAG TPA: ATP-dependent helicase, partial [Bacteroidetes bacterium]|nr:ATP-dependent helicase [Bacteroidota bacterium]
TLTYKIAYELSKLKSKKQYIVAITYTNRASVEIKDSIELMGVDTKQLWIGTIHAFCLEWILRPYHLYISQLKYGFRVINSHDSEEIITQLCKEYNESKGVTQKEGITFWDCSYIITENLKFRCTTPKEDKAVLSKIILKKYFRKLLKEHKIDFELILYYSLKILKENPSISKILSNIFPYLIIDEYQDTRGIQYHIVSMILNASNKESKLFMVGDPNQSIFESLGGYSISKNDLETLTNLEIKEYELSDNYRSSSKIISYFDFYKTHPNNINASGKNKDHPSLITFNSQVTKDNLVEEVVRLIRFNINEQGISQNEICVIAPWWVHLLSLTRKVMAELPEYNFDGSGLAPFSRDIDNFWYKLSRIVLTEASPNLYVRRLRWSGEVLEELDNIGVDISRITKKGLLKECNSISIDEEDGLVYLGLFFRELFNRFGIDKDFYPSLKEHHDAFFESSQRRIERLENDGIEYAGHISIFKKVFKEKDGITISTIHGVKGAEFDTVIAVGLLEGIVPHFNDINDDNVSDENRAKRLLYVIASRARKNLHLISEERQDNFKNDYQVTNVLSKYKFQYNE